MVHPTDEQTQAVEKFQTARLLKIAAFAGTGKTSTLILMAQSRKSKGLYLAFNKAIATEAQERFPPTVNCRTTHSLAYRAVLPSYGSSDKLTGSISAPKLADLARFPTRSFGNLSLNGVQQAHLVLSTITRFCQSMDRDIAEDHVPLEGRLMAAGTATIAEVRGWSVAKAKGVWRRMTARSHTLPMGHDGYLKLWALSDPKLNVEYVLLDEAQDTNQVVLGVLQQLSCQIVYVGDRHQQIYEWRGAVNAMEKVTGCDATSLTQSFRFGEPIARAASLVLGALGETQRLKGNPQVKSTIMDATAPTRAVLARTNSGVVIELLNAMRSRRNPCVVGGTGELSRLLNDVRELKEGKPVVSAEFFGFTSWPDVVDFSESEEGKSIKTFVQLVEQHGVNKLWPAVTSVQKDESTADVVLSTAHKAKGREWDSVRLAGDFVSTRTDVKPADHDAVCRLFYVAMTRAKRLLAVDPEQLTHFTIEPKTSHRATTAGETSKQNSQAGQSTAPKKKRLVWKRVPIR